MTVSAVRWALVDTAHALTGLRLPPLDFSRLGANVTAFGLLIEIHYRHYQFYANMFVATAIAYICYRVKLCGVWPLGWIDAGLGFLELVFFATSRDTLRKYYARSQQLLAVDRDARASAFHHGKASTAENEAPVPAGRRSPQDSGPVRHTLSATE
jgi:hypothetical protein